MSNRPSVSRRAGVHARMPARIVECGWCLLVLFACAPLTACADGMHVSSPGLPDGTTMPRAQVYDALGCNGGNRSPALQWSGAPAQTRSFAVTVFDPDAGARGWWHWVLYDLPPTAQSLPEDASRNAPPGTLQAHNDFGTPGYGGPCPPPGPAHRYRIVVHALRDAHLAVAPDADVASVAAAIDKAQIAQAQVEVRYGR